MTITKWLFAMLLVVQAHFAASYLVTLYRGSAGQRGRSERSSLASSTLCFNTLPQCGRVFTHLRSCCISIGSPLGASQRVELAPVATILGEQPSHGGSYYQEGQGSSCDQLSRDVPPSARGQYVERCGPNVYAPQADERKGQQYFAPDLEKTYPQAQETY